MPDTAPQPVPIKNIETPDLSAAMFRFGIDLEHWIITHVHFARSMCISSADDLVL